MLGSRAEVLALKPDYPAMGSLPIGVVGPWQAGDGKDAQFEVRAFIPGMGVAEDPVTGSLNAGLGQWLTGARLAPPKYVVCQGTALGRNGRVHVEKIGEDVWIGGETVTCVEGTVAL
jgi:PhzF family phenazine biosynthesis protein